MFIACRQQSVPRTFKEISAVANTTTTIKDIGRCYKIIRKELVNSNTNPTGISSGITSDLIVRVIFSIFIFKMSKNQNMLYQKAEKHLFSRKMIQLFKEQEYPYVKT